ncbi:MAG: glycolate oxidase iron-sulfur subunit [Porticoccaceae bacterium]|nr:MAG: glycolate oxidase iron-sulfur subunit [Porticoccaceae bacterium]
MQTHFTDSQRIAPGIRSAEAVLRKCVHCGFCTATCPTYRITGDELESPRGRIALIQDLLETGAAPTPLTVSHLDHCLSCLSCESTCPSGVSYRLLIDQARELIEEKYRRPPFDRWLRALLAWLLPKQAWFRAALVAGRWSRPLLRLAGRFSLRIDALARMVPGEFPSASSAIQPGTYPAEGTEIRRVALILGCVQGVLAPEIDAATLRLLRRHGCTVVVPPPAAGCCGALPHHLGKGAPARAMTHRNLDAWRELVRVDSPAAVDTVLMTASGCGSHLKDYAHLLPDDGDAVELARRVKDLSQLLDELAALTPLRVISGIGAGLTLAWQSPCSLQHGFNEKSAPIRVLQACGFEVREPLNPHLCCGSAGTYNLLQPEFAERLGRDKADAITATGATIAVSANIGCITQLRAKLAVEGDRQPPIPLLHLAQILDWATGGERPAALGNNK